VLLPSSQEAFEEELLADAEALGVEITANASGKKTVEKSGREAVQEVKK